jgi:general secretion pathway protein K
MDKNHTDDAMDAFLSGQITDQQALLNVRNLVQDGKPKPAAVQAFTRLFNQLDLPITQLQTLVDQLIASDAANNAETKPDAQSQSLVKATAPLKPFRMEQLVWMGLPTRTVQALMPYATLLPVATPLNLNTASAEVLHAALPSVDMGQAHQIVATRASSHFKSVAEGLKAANVGEDALRSVDNNDFSVGTHFFAVRGRLRLGESTVQEVSLVERNATLVKVVWRQREVQTAAAMASLQ